MNPGKDWCEMSIIVADADRLTVVVIFKSIRKKGHIQIIIAPNV